MKTENKETEKYNISYRYVCEHCGAVSEWKKSALSGKSQEEIFDKKIPSMQKKVARGNYFDLSGDGKCEKCSKRQSWELKSAKLLMLRAPAIGLVAAGSLGWVVWFFFGLLGFLFVFVVVSFFAFIYGLIEYIRISIHMNATIRRNTPEIVWESVALNQNPLQDAFQPQAAPQVPNGLYDGRKEQEDALLSTPPKYNGIQWFLKVLRHYADFSGRARRREYWYFVLFNFIFLFAWTFLISFVFLITNDKHVNVELATNIAIGSYYLAMMLPAMAVTVRRLHDLGKSGWMMFITLIPFVGSIWMLVLMFTEGEHEKNKYGHNPQISEKPFGEPAKIKSAGIVLTVAAAAGLLGIIIFEIVTKMTNVERPYDSYRFYYNYWMYNSFIIYALQLAAGIFLLIKKQINGMQGKTTSLWLLLVASSAFILFNIRKITHIIGGIIHFSRNNLNYFSGLNSGDGLYFVSGLIFIFLNLLILLFVASALFFPQNKKLLRYAAVISIVFSGFAFLWGVYFSMCLSVSDWGAFNMFNVLIPVAYIVLAGTFLSVKNSGEPVRRAATDNATKRMFPEDPVLKNNPYRNVSPVDGVRKESLYIILEHKVGSKYHRAGEEQKITGNYAEIGRDPNCMVRYDEHFETVSRRHAAIFKESDHWKLVPLSQTNPTIINGKRVQKEWFLQHGDEIQCAVNGPKLIFRNS